MRADRLVSLLLLVQARGRVTASEVAEELEISQRTARRDLDALAMAGVPIYSSRGRGGGWSLVGGARTDLTGMSSVEARALVLAANVGGSSGSAVGPLDAALRKLVQAMPEPFRAEARATSDAIHVDPNRWSGPTIGEQPPFLEPLQAAVIQGRQVELGYQSPGREPSLRRVHPLGLVTKAGVWYLVAGTAAGQRTFRVGRVQSVDVFDEVVERPTDFDLGAAWDGIKETFGAQLSSVDIVAEAILEGWALGPLRSLPSSRLEVVDEEPGGAYRVLLSARSVNLLAYGFAGLGPGAVVLSPPEVLEALALIGQDLVDAYGQADAGG